MSAESSGRFTLKELNRIKVLQDVIDRKMTPGRAAVVLGITPRHCSRLIKRYREHGPLGMNNIARGNPSNRLLPKSFTDQIVDIVKKNYPDFGPTLAREKLEEIHGLTIGKETLRRLMIRAGLWIPRKMRAPKIHQPRYRRPCTGELIQIDGCDHDWFEGRGPKCTALVYVDDATSKIMELLFVQTESTFTYFNATRRYIERHGKPLAFYSDKAGTFRINNKNAIGGDGHTQFGRAMHELNIQTICAETSQAKGRVERAHSTLQDRLVKEFRLRNISSIEAANAFTDEFIDDYNHRFGKLPRHEYDVHRPLEQDEDLDTILTIREYRKVSKNLTIQYDKIVYLIEDSEYSRRAIGKCIDVYHYPDERIHQPRYRRPCTGELIQIDGCDHDWFEGRGPKCTALVYVDDATSKIMELLFVQTESTFTYFNATRRYIERHGKPLAFYSDKAGTFRINNKNAIGGDGHTQFGRAMHELNIQTICAETSQAKGRVERAHSTLQDRLVKEFRLRNISSIEAANAFTDEFIDDYNHRFGKLPRHEYDVHRPLEQDEDLDTILTIREYRKVSKNLTIQYDKIVYLIEDSEYSRRAIGKCIDVYHYPDERKELRLNGIPLPFITYDRLSDVDQGAIVDNKRLGRALELIKTVVDDKRDNRRSQSVPAGNGPSRRKEKAPGKKSQRSIDHNDMLEALVKLQGRSKEIFGKK